MLTNTGPCMRITCQNCIAGYKIPTELLGRKGRSVKCARCGHSWFQPAPVSGKFILEEPGASGCLQTPSHGGGSLLGEGLEEAGGDAVSWLDRQPGGDGMPGMPGMPAAMPGAPGAMGGLVQVSAEGDLDGGPLSGEKAEGDDAIFQASKYKSGGDDDEDLVGPDEGHPGFGSTGKKLGDGDHDLDDAPLAGGDAKAAGKAEKKKPKEKSKRIDPAHIIVGVLAVGAILLGSILFLARDRLTELWPGIEVVYEALIFDE